MESVEAILRHLLTAPLEAGEVPDVAGWWERHRRHAGAFGSPVMRAMAGALQMDRLGWAFASGYHEALHRLVPSLAADEKAALCATEEGGNRPRAIETRLEATGDGWRFTGRKKFITLGTEADVLLVVATEGERDDGRKRLAVVRVPVGREGVHLDPLPTLPFVPEIPHASGRFEGVRVEPAERLPGDGYTDYLKPFRTVEDLHVHGALLAWLVGTGRRLDWPEATLEGLLSLVATVLPLAAAPPLDQAVHVALAGAIAAAGRAVAELDPLWESADEELRLRWQRDRGLLAVASTARNKRSEAAWVRLRGGT